MLRTTMISLAMAATVLGKSFVQATNSTISGSSSHSIIITEESAHYLYSRWKIQYREEVSIPKEQDKDALEQFTINLRMVDAHNKRYNKGQETYYMSMNAFSHLSWNEFRSTYISGYVSQPKKGSIHYANTTTDQSPKSVDWTKKGGKLCCWV